MKLTRLGVILALLVATVFTAGADVRRLEPAVRAVAVAADPTDAARRTGFVVRDGLVQVEVVVAGGAESRVTSWLDNRGARFVLAARDRVQAFVPPAMLTDLGEVPDVLTIQRPIYAELPEPLLAPAQRRLGTLAVESEAVAAMNVAAWRAEGFTGEGVRVGVIDVEFGGWEDLLGSELPPTDRTIYRAFGGASAEADAVHGTACAEIVHDIAPDAELYLAHIRTSNDFYSALDWLASEGVDVATMSLGWYGAGPGDGTGRFADAITQWSQANDSLFITSGGNDRRSHWQGVSANANQDGWVEYDPGVDLNRLSLTIAEEERAAVNLVWNDWSSPTSDYSLHLVRLDDGEEVEVAVSDRSQTGQAYQTPYEQISYTAEIGGRFAVRIGRDGVVGSHDMELFSFDSDLEIAVAEGSLTSPSDTAAVMAVAAVSYSSPHGVRSFSSAGPTNGPGGSLAGGSVKPDISGYDGVSTVSYGTRSFYGTSAAAPHVAGAAAVVLSSDPAMSRTALRDFLEERALDLGPTGKDNDTGWGRVVLGQPPVSSCTFSIEPTHADAAASGGDGVVQLTTEDGCTWSTSSNVEWISTAPASGSGSRTIGYSVDENTGPPRSGDLLIAGLTFTVNQAGQLPTVSTMVAGIAETGGLAGTRWKSDLAVLNPGTAAADVALSYRHSGGTASTSMTVGAGEIVELGNVAVDTFGAADSAGAVELTSAAELIVTARTYNDTPDGTFGQYLPGVAMMGGFDAQSTAVLPQLVGNDDFRTNIGFVDLGGIGAVARITLLDGSGDPVGDALNQSVPAGGWSQRNRVFDAAGAGDCEGCYALIDVLGGGVVWAYASVVDDGSGDPTTIPMSLSNGGAATTMVAGIAETAGANDTTWRSNLALLNLAGRGVTAGLVYRHQSDSASTSVTLADGELVEFASIAANLFGSPDTAGAVKVDADGQLLVTARTFNDAPAGTFGQFLPGVAAPEALIPGEVGYLSQLKSTDSYRTNIGFASFSDVECSVRTRLFNGQGQELETTYASVPATGWTQNNRVFVSAGVAPVAVGYATVEVLTPTCEIWPYASVVDNVSGDPTTVPVAVR